MLTEVWAVWDAKQREAALLKRRRSSKSAGQDGVPSKSKSSSSSRLNAALGIQDSNARRDGAVNTGQLDVALNPLFVNGATPVGQLATPSSALDAVRNFKHASPPLDMWRVIASSYEDLYGQAAAMAAELAATKADLERAKGDEAPRPAPGRAGQRTRTQFNPQSAAGESVDGAFSEASPVNPLRAGNSMRGLDAYAARR